MGLSTSIIANHFWNSEKMGYRPFILLNFVYIMLFIFSTVDELHKTYGTVFDT